MERSLDIDGAEETCLESQAGIVTGGGRGIDRAITLALAAAGASVARSINPRQ
jgi:NAD(P)-dependent dehydrogenase (short-subunit alcohol dehydrogenase family)